MPEISQFPENFIWGVATSSYQIEGAVSEDGKGPSIWDTFSHTPGKTFNGDTGDIACDHYHRWPEDIQLMKDLGVSAYRFSISWPRIFPTAENREPNQKGLAFYSRLVDALLEAGIEPFVTLYHWDMPQWLQDQGGWTVRSVIPAFVQYAQAVSEELGDRVKNWITHNEPLVVSHHGHLDGCHAPGHTDLVEALTVAHHLLLSHGRAVPVIRKNSPNSKVGITLNLTPGIPASPSKADSEAAKMYDGMTNRWFLDPVFKGKYPQDVIQTGIEQAKFKAEDLTFIQDGDLKEISVPLDFLGVNYYSRAVIRDESIPEDQNKPFEVIRGECTDIGWEIHADTLTDLLVHLKNEYAVKSMFITENGAAYHTGPDKSGEINDHKRISYLHQHLLACSAAISRDVPLHGYFEWTLIDNFEWAHGYFQKFGMIWMDPVSLKRTPKKSYYWYQETIKNNSITKL